MSKFCHGCGKELHESARQCPACGAELVAPTPGGMGKAVLAVVCWFVGVLGVHRFMTGKIGSGVAQLILTLTFFGIIVSGIWALIDFIIILTGGWTDKSGAKITQW